MISIARKALGSMVAICSMTPGSARTWSAAGAAAGGRAASSARPAWNAPTCRSSARRGRRAERRTRRTRRWRTPASSSRRPRGGTGRATTRVRPCGRPPVVAATGSSMGAGSGGAGRRTSRTGRWRPPFGLGRGDHGGRQRPRLHDRSLNGNGTAVQPTHRRAPDAVLGCGLRQAGRFAVPCDGPGGSAEVERWYGSCNDRPWVGSTRRNAGSTRSPIRCCTSWPSPAPDRGEVRPSTWRSCTRRGTTSTCCWCRSSTPAPRPRRR